MILIHFSDIAAKRRALAGLAGRFPFESRANGDMLVPESALAHLATEGIAFAVDGSARPEEESTPTHVRQSGLRAEHAGRWVAWAPGIAEVVAGADSPLGVREMGRRMGRDDLIYEWVPPIPSAGRSAP